MPIIAYDDDDDDDDDGDDYDDGAAADDDDEIKHSVICHRLRVCTRSSYSRILTIRILGHSLC